MTLKAAAAGFTIALVLGLLFALLRRSKLKSISWTTAIVVEFLRDTTLLVQLFFLYYVLPDLGIVVPAFLTGALALGLQYAAYTSEVYRGGIEAVPHSQWEAATALNLTRMQTYRDIVIPQIIPRIVPTMGNYLVVMIKETPVLSVITVLEMMGLANMISERTFDYLVPLSLVGLIFLLLTLFPPHSLDESHNLKLFEQCLVNMCKPVVTLLANGNFQDKTRRATKRLRQNMFDGGLEFCLATP